MAVANVIKLNPLLQYKCHACDGLPKDEQISRCATNSDHILCILCAIRNGNRCPCGGTIESIANPLINIVTSKCCPFKSSGCEWVFGHSANISAHTSECKYRPYTCIGTTMNLWKCHWLGLQKDFADHMQREHLSDRQVFKYWHIGSLPHAPAKNAVHIDVIDAFNKKFLLFYVSFASSSCVHFVVQLLGRKLDAEKYVIEFEVGGELRKMKFIEPCHSDADDLLCLLNTKQTMTIHKDYFKQYANAHGRVPFQFILKRKTAVIEENRQRDEYFKATMLAGDGREAYRPDQNVPKVFPKSTPGPAARKQAPTATHANARSNGKHFRNNKNDY